MGGINHPQMVRFLLGQPPFFCLWHFWVRLSQPKHVGPSAWALQDKDGAPELAKIWLSSFILSHILLAVFIPKIIWILLGHLHEKSQKLSLKRPPCPRAKALVVDGAFLQHVPLEARQVTWTLLRAGMASPPWRVDGFLVSESWPFLSRECHGDSKGWKVPGSPEFHPWAIPTSPGNACSTCRRGRRCAASSCIKGLGEAFVVCSRNCELQWRSNFYPPAIWRSYFKMAGL